jgi:cytochrome c oxidase subunit 1
MVFLFLGFSFILLMRWQLAYPEQALPVIGRLFGVTRMPEGVMLPEFYNQLGAMHGTIMVFLGVVPLAVGAFGGIGEKATGRRDGGPVKLARGN